MPPKQASARLALKKLARHLWRAVQEMAHGVDSYHAVRHGAPVRVQQR